MAIQGKHADEPIAWADARWSDGQAGGHVKNVKPGLEQAEKLKPAFAEMLNRWLNASDGTYVAGASHRP